MENGQFTKSIIPVEIELGFVRIPNRYKKLFPGENSKIIFNLGEERKKILSYNSRHQRVFGLVSFFKSNNVEPRDTIIFERTGNKKFNLFIRKKGKSDFTERSFSKEEAEEIIKVSEISPRAKGDIVENRIKELIILYGQGILNVYEPSADIEGVDLIVVKRNVFQPLFIQVKSRFNLRKKSFQIRVKSSALNPHHTFFIVGAYYNPQEMDIDDYMLFISSEDFVRNANIINKGKKNELYVVNTLLRENSNNKFSNFTIKKDNLVTSIFKKFNEIERYYK